VPFLIYTIAALGLNILIGYCGQLSLGTGGFMAVGAYASFKLMTAFPELNIVFVILLAGLVHGGGGRGCSACRRCGSRASTWRWRRWPRSSS
jgi:branched-chain amino acid transport system permease protein